MNRIEFSFSMLSNVLGRLAAIAAVTIIFGVKAGSHADTPGPITTATVTASTLIAPNP